MVKPPLRTKSLGTKVSDGEYVRLEALASTCGQTISELIRSVLLEEIASPNGHTAGGWRILSGIDESL